jgi:hypothetical protein
MSGVRHLLMTRVVATLICAGGMLLQVNFFGVRGIEARTDGRDKLDSFAYRDLPNYTGQTENIGGRSQSLALTIEVAKDTFILGEPIVILGILTNVSSQPVKLLRSNNLFKVYLSTEGEHFTEIKEGLFASPKEERKEEKMDPGESWEFHSTVLYSYERSDKLTFSRAGSYFLRGEYRGYRSKGYYDETGWPDFPKSKPIKVTVRNPTGVDAEVFELLRDEDSTFNSYGYVVHNAIPEAKEELVERFYRIVHSFPQSAYGDVLRDSLIRYFEGRIKVMNKPGFSEEEKRMYESLQQQRPPN